VKAIAQLPIDLSRVIEVRAAKREAVVDQEMAVRDV
jgi:hypothetical protein